MNRYELAAILAVADIDDRKWHRLTAVEQRALFGFAVCGRKEFRLNPDGQGEIMLRKSVPPGDSIFAVYSYAEMATAINRKEQLEVR